MMQQAAGGGYPQPTDQQQQQQSPRGGMPKLSLLSHYAAAAAAAPPFSILGALEQQQQHFHHQMAPPHPHPNAFQNLLHQGFLITPAGQQGGYNLQLAAAAPPPQMLQGLMEDLIKLSPPGSPPPIASSSPSSSYNLVSLLEQKTEQLQALVRSLSQQQQQQQQQHQQQHNGNVQHSHAVMAAAQIASNISQIALGMLPTAPSSCLDMPPPFNLSVVTATPMPAVAPATAVRNPLPVVVNLEQPPAAFNLQVSAPQNNANNANDDGEQEAATAMEDGDSAAGSGSRDEDDDGEAEAEVEAEGDGEGEGEELVPGSYDLVEMNAVEILAEHTHFCDKCGKGFKRDANLRMHMRGHGEQYKSPAALARPDKLSSQEPGAAVRPRRYSCPYAGCKRNKKHRKFQPLKTVLCVKNHYRRSHCPKSLTCSKCKSKKFSVVADLKTHEKHCGRDKWQCSCGTTFSRKDKLLGHISLFQGHTPAMPLNDHAALPHAPAAAPAPPPEAAASGAVAGVTQGGSSS